MDPDQHPQSPSSMAGISASGAGATGNFDGRMQAPYGYGYPADPSSAFSQSSNPPLDPNAMQFQFGSAAAVSNPYALPSNSSSKQRKEIKRRTKTGCLTCRKRRIKCDEAQPVCNNCRKSRRECAGYDPTFRGPHDASTHSPTNSSSAQRSAGGQHHGHSPTQSSAYPAPPPGYAAASPNTFPFSASSPSTSAQHSAAGGGTVAASYDFSAAIDPALQSISVNPPSNAAAAMYSQPGDFHVEGEQSLESPYVATEPNALNFLAFDASPTHLSAAAAALAAASAVGASTHPTSLFPPRLPSPEGTPFRPEVEVSPVNVNDPTSLSCECMKLPAGVDELHICLRHSYFVPAESPVDPDYTYEEFCKINFELILPAAGGGGRGGLLADLDGEEGGSGGDGIDSVTDGNDVVGDEGGNGGGDEWIRLPTLHVRPYDLQMLWERYCNSSFAMFRITFYHGFYERSDARHSLFKATAASVDGSAHTYHQWLSDSVALTLSPVRPASVDHLLQVNSLEYPSERPALPLGEDTLQQVRELFNYYSTGLAKFLETQWLPGNGWAHLAKDSKLLEKYALLLSRMEFTADKNAHENLVNLTVESHIIWDSLALVKTASDDIKHNEAASALVADIKDDGYASNLTDTTMGGSGMDDDGEAKDADGSSVNANSNDDNKKINPPPPPPLPGSSVTVDATVYIDVHETALRFEVLKALITNTLVDQSVVDGLSSFDSSVPAHFTTFHRQVLSRERSFWRNTARFLTLDTLSPDPNQNADPAVVDEALIGMRGLLESKENRDIMYSVAIMRVWPRRLMERERALKDQGIENPQLDKDDLQKVDVAKNFLVQQAGGRGTTVASQRICGMILRAWGGAGFG